MPARSALARTLALVALAAGLAAAPPAGRQRRIVYEVQSPFQRITVLDTEDGFRRLIFDARFDGLDPIQSEMNLADPNALTLPYTRHSMVALPLVQAPRRILVVGLGGGSMQRYLYALLPDAVVETAEIDPDVLDVARRFFFFKEDERQIVHVGDGRAFIESSSETFDAVFLDAYSGLQIPYSLTTMEFLEAVKRRLAPGGVVSANLVDGSTAFPDILKTYAAVFPEIHVVKCAQSGNSILIALPAKTDLTVDGWAERAEAFEAARPTGLDLPKLIRRGAAEATRIPARAVVLRDKRESAGPRPAARIKSGDAAPAWREPGLPGGSVSART